MQSIAVKGFGRHLEKPDASGFSYALICTVRDVQVMLDIDLAKLYDVETKVFNQAVSCNSKRFPERYRFQLTREEADSLRSQIVTSNMGDRDGRRYLPYVLTEQDVSTLASVLRSDVTIDVSIRIIDAFELTQGHGVNAAKPRQEPVRPHNHVLAP